MSKKPPNKYKVNTTSLRKLAADAAECRCIPVLKAALECGLPSLDVIHGTHHKRTLYYNVMVGARGLKDETLRDEYIEEVFALAGKPKVWPTYNEQDITFMDEGKLFVKMFGHLKVSASYLLTHGLHKTKEAGSYPGGTRWLYDTFGFEDSITSELIISRFGFKEDGV